MVTIQEAKKLIKAELDKQQARYYKITARTWDFTDLLRCRMIVVSVNMHPYNPIPILPDLEAIAKKNGFIVRFE